MRRDEALQCNAIDRPTRVAVAKIRNLREVEEQEAGVHVDFGGAHKSTGRALTRVCWEVVRVTWGTRAP